MTEQFEKGRMKRAILGWMHPFHWPGPTDYYPDVTLRDFELPREREARWLSERKQYGIIRCWTKSRYTDPWCREEPRAGLIDYQLDRSWYASRNQEKTWRKTQRRFMRGITTPEVIEQQWAKADKHVSLLTNLL